MVEPGTGIVMADHDIHSTEVVGDQAAIGLSLYGYALARFPSVTWFHSGVLLGARDPVAPACGVRR